MTHGKIVFDRCLNVVDEFIARCEASRNGLQPSPAHEAFLALRKNLTARETDLVNLTRDEVQLVTLKRDEVQYSDRGA